MQVCLPRQTAARPEASRLEAVVRPATRRQDGHRRVVVRQQLFSALGDAPAWVLFVVFEPGPPVPLGAAPTEPAVPGPVAVEQEVGVEVPEGVAAESVTTEWAITELVAPVAAAEESVIPRWAECCCGLRFGSVVSRRAVGCREVRPQLARSDVGRSEGAPLADRSEEDQSEGDHETGSRDRRRSFGTAPREHEPAQPQARASVRSRGLAADGPSEVPLWPPDEGTLKSDSQTLRVRSHQGPTPWLSTSTAD